MCSKVILKLTSSGNDKTESAAIFAGVWFEARLKPTSAEEKSSSSAVVEETS